jgi:hypothetical protein
MTVQEVIDSTTTNFLLSLITNPAITAILGALGGVFITLSTKLGEGWINEFYEGRKHRRSLRQIAASDITSFVTEGIHTGFRHKAGSERHIGFRATEIEALDELVGKKLRAFLSTWIQHRNLLKHHPPSVENDRNLIRLNNKAQNLGDELLGVAGKWSQ